MSRFVCIHECVSFKYSHAAARSLSISAAVISRDDILIHSHCSPELKKKKIKEKKKKTFSSGAALKKKKREIQK